MAWSDATSALLQALPWVPGILTSLRGGGGGGGFWLTLILLFLVGSCCCCVGCACGLTLAGLLGPRWPLACRRVGRLLWAEASTPRVGPAQVRLQGYLRDE